MVRSINACRSDSCLPLNVDDPMFDNIKTSKKWKSIVVAILTGSQLLLFRNRNVLPVLEKHEKTAPDEVLDFAFTPDEVISLHDAFAVKVEDSVRDSPSLSSLSDTHDHNRMD